jgi:hypothetical protein
MLTHFLGKCHFLFRSWVRRRFNWKKTMLKFVDICGHSDMENDTIFENKPPGGRCEGTGQNVEIRHDGRTHRIVRGHIYAFFAAHKIHNDHTRRHRDPARIAALPLFSACCSVLRVRGALLSETWEATFSARFHPGRRSASSEIFYMPISHTSFGIT